MKIFPAIDIKDKKCVRLFKGQFNSQTTYNQSPLDQALLYKKNGLIYNKSIIKLDCKVLGFSKNARKTLSRLISRTKTKEERRKISKELEYSKGFLKSVQAKLNNERFVKNAPESVVVNEKNKMADVKERIQILEKKIDSL